jgi:HSP20 family protein
MARLSEQVRQGAEHAWASLSEGWRELLTRASGALTRFRRDGAAVDTASSAAFGNLASGTWGLLAADIRVDDNRVVVRLEVPGMTREDLHIDIAGNRLSVWGDKQVDREAEEGDYRLVQCAYGSFRRDLLLPMAVDAERAVASYRDGVLRIEVPGLAHARGHRVLVQGD